jgi:signal transduction histidine kinase
MAQQIIAQHQGRLEVESTPGKGTRCTITLPVEIQ